MPEATKSLGENVGRKLHNAGFVNDFLDMIPKSQATKSKIGRWDSLNKRNNQQSQKATYRMGEHISNHISLRRE